MKLGVLHTAEGGRIAFWCPGCKEVHVLTTGQGPGPRWSFNGNHEKPTFSPSVLRKTGHHCSRQQGKDCWCTYEQRTGKPAPYRCTVCHSFVTDGQIRFLSDSTHDLAGQTVPLEPFDD